MVAGTVTPLLYTVPGLVLKTESLHDLIELPNSAASGSLSFEAALSPFHQDPFKTCCQVCFFKALPKDVFIHLRERGGKREGEKHPCRKKHGPVVSCMP